MNLLRYGDTGVLIEPDDDVEPVALQEWLRDRSLPGTVSVVPGARTVLVELDPAVLSLEILSTHLAEASVAARTPADGPVVEIPVRYDGPDLAEVAAQLGFDIDEVIHRHSSGRYRVAFCGFAPGFAYLTGLDPALHVPRLAEPRTAVPAGAVAIAGEFTAVYPRRSPGGWRLIGTSDARLWQVDRDPPALLAPGTIVRFDPT